MSFSLYCWTNCWRLLKLRLRSSGVGNEKRMSGVKRQSCNRRQPDAEGRVKTNSHLFAALGNRLPRRQAYPEWLSLRYSWSACPSRLPQIRVCRRLAQKYFFRATKSKITKPKPFINNMKFQRESPLIPVIYAETDFRHERRNLCKKSASSHGGRAPYECTLSPCSIPSTSSRRRVR